MDKISEKVTKVLVEWANRTIPNEMSVPELQKFGKQINLNWETLRNIKKRQTYRADTIVRALLGSGVAVKTLIDLPINPKLSLLPKEKEWIQFGRTLSEKERVEYIELLKHIRKIIKNRYKHVKQTCNATRKINSNATGQEPSL